MAVMSEPVVEERAEAFEDFFHAHHERLLRAMYLATGDRHEAEDLAQEAFVRILERWERVRGLDYPVGYLYRTALNNPPEPGPPPGGGRPEGRPAGAGRRPT